MFRNIIEIDEELCTGCGMCILDCAEGALKLENGKAKVIGEHLCDGLGHCLQCCPTGALQIIQREAEEYDPEAVRTLQEMKLAQFSGAAQAGGAEPGVSQSRCGGMEIPSSFVAGGISAHPVKWPVKLVLQQGLPAGADVLLCADCAPVVVDDFRKRFYEKYHVVTVCPKFQDTKALAERLGGLLRASPPASVTCMRMSVPCCQGLFMLGKRALDISGSSLNPGEVVIDLDGVKAADK